jgi:3-phosphoinositide dependent protein kinase-1
VDLWALGIIVYQMLTGTTPFKAANEYLIFEKIRAGVVEYPETMDSDARDFI